MKPKIPSINIMLINKIYERRFALLLMSIGLIYFWFGLLKFFPGLSPAENLAKTTICHLAFGLMPERSCIISLAIWETTLGMFMLCNRMNRFILIFAITHMVCTFLPFIFLPSLSYNGNVFSPTLAGQYILKNIIIIIALIVIYAERKKTVVGDTLVSTSV